MEKIELEEAYNLLKPEVFVFVISIDAANKPSGMIAAWCMRCSANPPLYAVALSKKGNTQNLIRKSKEFVIALPNKSLEKEVELFGSTHGDQINKFAKTKLETEKARYITSPLISKATLNLECKLENEVDAGDHVLFIGKILTAHKGTEDGILLNMRKKNKKRIFQEFYGMEIPE